MDVVSVESGPELAKILASRHPDAELLVSHAEDIEFADSSFDQHTGSSPFPPALDTEVKAVLDALNVENSRH